MSIGGPSSIAQWYCVACEAEGAFSISGMGKPKTWKLVIIRISINWFVIVGTK